MDVAVLVQASAEGTSGGPSLVCDGDIGWLPVAGGISHGVEGCDLACNIDLDGSIDATSVGPAGEGLRDMASGPRSHLPGQYWIENRKRGWSRGWRGTTVPGVLQYFHDIPNDSNAQVAEELTIHGWQQISRNPILHKTPGISLGIVQRDTGRVEECFPVVHTLQRHVQKSVVSS